MSDEFKFSLRLSDTHLENDILELLFADHTIAVGVEDLAEPHELRLRQVDPDPLNHEPELVNVEDSVGIGIEALEALTDGLEDLLLTSALAGSEELLDFDSDLVELVIIELHKVEELLPRHAAVAGCVDPMHEMPDVLRVNVEANLLEESPELRHVDGSYPGAIVGRLGGRVLVEEDGEVGRAAAGREIQVSRGNELANGASCATLRSQTTRGGVQATSKARSNRS